MLVNVQSPYLGGESSQAYSIDGEDLVLARDLAYFRLS